MTVTTDRHTEKENFMVQYDYTDIAILTHPQNIGSVSLGSPDPKPLSYGNKTAPTAIYP
ncbi:MAG: hypothetical protein KME57_31115 [Scytonema hyalinum WJT4-NPBG1]|jgi:hypothetical protein|nr:hypothetical protein [Scytonema hyalinum WJT4-NPBG1]